VPDVAPVLDAVLVDVPLTVPFRGLTSRETVLLHGPAGWAEWGPFVEYGPAEAARWWQAAVEHAVIGLPAPRRHTVPVNATVPAVPAAQVSAVLARFPGCTTAKVKVGGSGTPLEEDLALLREVRRQLGPTARIRIDVNGAWDAAAALRLLPAYDRAAEGLEYVEQPCPTVEELALVRREQPVPVAADESIRRAEDPYRVADAQAADVLVLKVAPLGGVRACLTVAQRTGVPVVVSSALDTSVGLAAGVALAAALPALPFACGLGTAALFAADVTDRPLLPVAGGLAVRPVTVDWSQVERIRGSSTRTAWWRARMADMREHAGDAVSVEVRWVG
jgi:O-succinylbenzoate synthase